MGIENHFCYQGPPRQNIWFLLLEETKYFATSPLKKGRKNLFVFF